MISLEIPAALLKNQIMLPSAASEIAMSGSDALLGLILPGMPNDGPIRSSFSKAELSLYKTQWRLTYAPKSKQLTFADQPNADLCPF